jgi:hypothetical protein
VIASYAQSAAVDIDLAADRQAAGLTYEKNRRERFRAALAWLRWYSRL